MAAPIVFSLVKATLAKLSTNEVPCRWLPVHIYKYTDSGSKEKAIKHPLYRLIHDEPNLGMTSFVFRETLITHLLLYGNAYAQIIRNGKGEVIPLYPLMANRMSVDRDDKGHLYYQYQMQDSDAPTMKNGTVILRQPLKPISSPRFIFILMPSFTFFDVDSTSFWASVPISVSIIFPCSVKVLIFSLSKITAIPFPFKRRTYNLTYTNNFYSQLLRQH